MEPQEFWEDSKNGRKKIEGNSALEEEKNYKAEHENKNWGSIRKELELLESSVYAIKYK